MRTDDLLLVSGLLCVALGAGLCQFPMIGLIGAGLFVVALGLLLTAGIIARPAGELHLWQQITGAMLYAVGIFLLLAVAGHASGLAYEVAMSSRPALSGPSTGNWITLGLASLLSALVILLGIRLRTRWSWRRCSLWGVAGLGVVPLALLFFWIFAAKWPLTV